jgi:hypothetical protein
MKTLNGFPYFEVEFNKKGESSDADQVQALTDFLASGKASDLFVISHGWNNDMAEARDLYTRFFDCVRQVLDAKEVQGVDKRKFAVMAVLWPSHKFADKELIASGAASVGSRSATRSPKPARISRACAAARSGAGLPMSSPARNAGSPMRRTWITCGCCAAPAARRAAAGAFPC